MADGATALAALTVRLLLAVQRRWLWLSGFALALVSILSLIPLQHLPPAPGSDKLHHLIAYGCVMFPVALRRPGYPARWLVFFLCWSGVIELLQPLVNRYAQWLDLAANGVGLCVGVLAGWIARGWISRWRNTQEPIHR